METPAFKEPTLDDTVQEMKVTMADIVAFRQNPDHLKTLLQLLRGLVVLGDLQVKYEGHLIPISHYLDARKLAIQWLKREGFKV